MDVTREYIKIGDPKPPAGDRVTAGWDFLDERLGKDTWQGDADVPNLDMRALRDCLLAHISGESYFDAMEDLGLTQDDAIRYGFISWPVTLEDADISDYRDLTAEWKDRLTAWQAHHDA